MTRTYAAGLTPLSRRKAHILADWIVDVIETRLGLGAGEIRQSSRHSMRAVQARQLAAYLLNTELGLSQSETARRLRRHRSTVNHSLIRMEDSRDDPVFNRHLEQLTDSLHTLRDVLAGDVHEGEVAA